MTLPSRFHKKTLFFFNIPHPLSLATPFLSFSERPCMLVEKVSAFSLFLVCFRAIIKSMANLQE